MPKLRLNDILSEQDKQFIHDSAVKLLKEHGFLSNHKEMIDAFASAGCEIGEEISKPKGSRIIKFTEEIITDALAKSPSKFTLHPTAPDYTPINFGSDEVHFGTNASDMIWDLGTDELRGTTMNDFVVGSRLVDACEHISAIFGFPAYWMYDLLQKNEYHKYGYLGALMSGTTMLHTGKCQTQVYFASDDKELEDTFQLWYIAAGGKKEFKEKPCGAISCCITSPYSMMGGSGEPGQPLDWGVWTVAAAKAGAVIRLKSCGLLGLSSPVTIAANITQCTAEFLAANVAVQAINPGNPVVMGEYTGTTDLRTGSKAAVRPEAMLMRQGYRSMAIFYNKPTGWYLQSDAVKADSQAAWEHMSVYLLAALSDVNMVMSCSGLTSADTMCFKQMIIDNEMMGWAKHLAKSFEVNENTIPLELMKDISFGPFGKHFLGAPHTIQNFRDVIWQRSEVTNAYLRDAWIERGAKTIEERARERAKELIRKHRPNIPEDQQKKIRDYMKFALEREKVPTDEIKTIMDKTYMQD